MYDISLALLWQDLASVLVPSMCPNAIIQKYALLPAWTYANANPALDL